MDINWVKIIINGVNWVKIGHFGENGQNWLILAKFVGQIPSYVKIFGEWSNNFVSKGF